jgi:hypothetical protein
MTAKTKSKEEFWADLEAIGEKEVRERVAKRVYRDLEQQDLWSREWLLRREFNREFAFEQPKIVAEIELSKAMRAAYAKERGVIEATLAAAKAAERQATIATRIAVAALLVGIVAIGFSVLLDLR